MGPVDDALDRLDALVVYEAAKDALATVREELQRLREERDRATTACEKAIRERRSLEQKEDDWHSAYERAEAEVQRLTEGLREIDKLDGRYHDLNTARWMARKTLDAASPDGANTEGGEA